VHLEPSSGIWVDAEEFVRQARAAADLASEGRLDEAIAKYKSADSLYRGDYLQDEPFSDWCLFERERLKEVYINLMKQMASAVAKLGDPESAIGAYRAALSVDHGREDIHRELMDLLLREGRRDEAVRQYETCRRILMEELAVEPSLETQALHTSMLSGARS
jgi:DNA-binding SARP family transcriptional activator